MRSSGSMDLDSYSDMSGVVNGLSLGERGGIGGPVGGDMDGWYLGFNGRLENNDEFLSRGTDAKGRVPMRPFDEDSPLVETAPLPADELAPMEVAGPVKFDLAGARPAAPPVSEELFGRDSEVAGRRKQSEFAESSRVASGPEYYFGKPVRPVPSVQQYRQWLGTLFPYLPPAPPEETDPKPEKPWPAEAVDLAKTLLRTEQIARLEGGLRIEAPGRRVRREVEQPCLARRDARAGLTQGMARAWRRPRLPDRPSVVRRKAAGRPFSGLPAWPDPHVHRARPERSAAGSVGLGNLAARPRVFQLCGRAEAPGRRPRAPDADSAEEHRTRGPGPDRYEAPRRSVGRVPAGRQGDIDHSVRRVRRVGGRMVGRAHGDSGRRGPAHVANRAETRLGQPRTANARSTPNWPAAIRSSSSASPWSTWSTRNGPWPPATPISTTSWR